MSTKVWATVITAVVFVSSLVAFAGIGFGLGALSAVGSPQCNTNTPNSNCITYANQTVNEGTITGGVSFVSVNQGSQFVSSMVQNQPGTGLTFGMQMSSTGDCSGGHLRSDAWQGGYQGWYEIQFPQAVTLTLDGAQKTGSVFFIDENYSASGVSASQGTLVGCGQVVGEIHGPYSSNQYDHTIVLLGIYPQMTFSISWTTSGLYCDAGTGSITSQCYALGQSGQPPGYQVNNNGAWWITSKTTAVVLSGQASFEFVNTDKNYNGGTLTAEVYTAYGGSGTASNGESNGYEMVVDMPSLRGGGTAPWSNNPQTVPNYCLSGCPITWKIPLNASVNDSGNPAIDTFAVILYSSLAIGQITHFPVINPLYAPTTPVITYRSSGAGIYPAVDDTVYLTIYSNQTSTSGTLTTIDLIGYYLPPGAGVESAPGCGAAYITPCNGTPIQVSHTANGIVGTFTFKVAPPIEDTEIGLQAISSSNNSPSLSGWQLINIKPADCQTGQTCDPLQSSVTEWGIIGPILLSIAIVSGLLLAAFWVPWKYAVIILPVAGGVIVILLWLTGAYADMFAAGGILAPNLPPTATG